MQMLTTIALLCATEGEERYIAYVCQDKSDADTIARARLTIQMPPTHAILVANQVSST